MLGDQPTSSLRTLLPIALTGQAMNKRGEAEVIV